MGKTPSIGIRLQTETKSALMKAAKADTRSISSMAERILIEWLKANGFLKQ